MRVSFLGGGTDYPEYFLRHGGAVLGTAIDKFNYVTTSRFPSHLFDYCVRVSYRKVELVNKVEDIEHRVFRHCVQFCGLERDIEIHNVADLPAFTGLGSSSSFTVALLQSLHSFKGEYRTPMELAYEAIYVERRLLQDNVGCQDQTLAALGGFHLIEFRAEDQIIAHKVPISPERMREFEAHLLILFSGIRRTAADVIAHQLKRIPYNIDTLREMRTMVDEGWDVLTSGQPLSAFGELLHRGWQAKRRLDDGVSSALIDALYERGREAGALGGKLLGAGGGGFLLLFAPPEKHEAIRKVFSDCHSLSAKINAPGSQVVFSY